jgi:hypothetical protein
LRDLSGWKILLISLLGNTKLQLMKSKKFLGTTLIFVLPAKVEEPEMKISIQPMAEPKGDAI